jgi:hypothetical protein
MAETSHDDGPQQRSQSRLEKIQAMTKQLPNLGDRRPTEGILCMCDELVDAHFAEFNARTSDTPEALEHLKMASKFSGHCMNRGIAESADPIGMQARQTRHKKLAAARSEYRESLEKRLEIIHAQMTAGDRVKLHLDLETLYAFEISLYQSDLDFQVANSDRSVYHLTKAISHSAPGSSEVIDIRGKLAWRRFQRLLAWGMKEDADDAQLQALAVLKDRPDDVNAILTLSQVLKETFRYNGNPYVLDEAIQLGQDLVEQEDERESSQFIPHAFLVIALALHGRALARGVSKDSDVPHATRADSIADLDMAVELIRTACLLLPPEDIELRHESTIMLSLALMDRFKAREIVDDLEEAISQVKPLAVDENYAASKNAARQAFGQLLLVRYDYLGHREDLLAAGDITLKVLKWRGSITRGTVSLDSLLTISKAWARFVEMNATPDVRNKAFRTAYQARAIAKSIADSWSCRLVEIPCLLHLADLHLRRKLKFERVSDLKTARILTNRCIATLKGRSLPLFRSAARKKIEVLSHQDLSGNPELIWGLIRSALSYPESLFMVEQTAFAHQIAHVPEQLDKNPIKLGGYRRCLELFRQFSKTFPTSSVTESLALQDCLGNELAYIAHSTEELTDYNIAIAHMREFVEECQKSDYGRLGIGKPYQLARLLFWKFVNFRNERAAGEEALELLSKRCQNIANSLGDRLDDLLKIRNLQQLLGKGRQSIIDTFNIALDTYEFAMTEGHSLEDKMQLIRDYNGIAEQLAADAIELGLGPRSAFIFLETARNIVWNKLLNEQESLISLKERDQNLADEFEKLRQAKSTYKFSVHDAASKDPFIYAEQYCNLLRKIRRISPDFLRPSALVANAHELLGSIPLVAVVSYEPKRGEPKRSRALIIRGESFEEVPLPDFEPSLGRMFNQTLTQVIKLLFQAANGSYSLPPSGLDASQKLQQLMASASHSGNLTLQEALAAVYHPSSLAPGSSVFEAGLSIQKILLALLWTTLAKPILDHLGFLGPKSDSDALPRIYWLSSGWLGVIPIHLAGVHGTSMLNGDANTVHDRVVSSYIPGIKALAFLRTCSQQMKSMPPSGLKKALLVGLEKTPGITTELPNVPREIAEVTTELSGEFEIPNVLATTPAVEKELKLCSLAHFALHGRTNAQDPFKSVICLQDWNTVSQPLNVSNIMKQNFERCQLAYLSLCDAAVIGDERLRNEGLHITGAFHMAGVPHVIATWYPLVDRVSGEVAKHFYRQLKGDDGRVDASKSAYALHAAISELRRKVPDVFLWGVYAHFGL